MEGLAHYLTWYQDETEYEPSDITESDHETPDYRVEYGLREPHMGTDSIVF